MNSHPEEKSFLVAPPRTVSIDVEWIASVEGKKRDRLQRWLTLPGSSDDIHFQSTDRGQCLGRVDPHLPTEQKVRFDWVGSA